jgi:hypothetical protein
VRDGRPWHKKRQGGHLWWKESITPPEARYWEDKIGEYVLLKRYSHRPLNLLSWMTLYLVEPRRQGQKRERRKDLPVQVRHAVLMSFKASGGRLSNGVTTLQRHNLLPRLAWACQFAKVTDQILVWHIVTTRCDWSSRLHRRRHRGDDDDRTDGGGDNWLVATKLSNYCAYLVAAAPGLLPDCPAWAEKRYKEVAKDVQAALGKDMAGASESTAQGYERLLNELSESSRDTVLRHGAELGSRLVDAYVEDEAAAWRFLADFWSEMVLFVAPSKSVKGHVEAMGRGGEFVTLVWALLLHAGVTDRDETPHSCSIP